VSPGIYASPQGREDRRGKEIKPCLAEVLVFAERKGTPTGLVGIDAQAHIVVAPYGVLGDSVGNDLLDEIFQGHGAKV
jgi:hypothetical protein